MRVTNNMMTNSLVRYLTSQNEALFERQTTIASQKRINKPSDDPVATGKILDYRQTIASIEQYEKNIEDGKMRLEVTESTLDLVDDLLELVRSIAQTQGSTSTESRLLAAEEVKSIFDQVRDLANSKFEDNYMFAGYQTQTAPFERDETGLTTHDQYTVQYNGDSGEVRYIVAHESEISIDADGRPLFHNAAAPGGISAFDVMRDLIVALENDDTVAISAQFTLIDDAQVQIAQTRAANAPILQQLEISENHWNNFRPQIHEMMSKEEEADITKAVMELQSIELAYQTTLAAAARVFQQGLVNFLN